MAKSDVLVRMQADTKNYDANIAKARRQLDQFKKDNLSLGGVMKQTTSAMTTMAAQFVSVYAAIGAAKKVIGDMVNINKAFEQGTANLAAIMGRTREEITALTNQAKQLGATTRYTAMEITELQTNLARLGFTQQEILNSTTAVQALATATGADLGEAANLAGAALRGFGLNATEMERVASVLSVSTTKSALSFDKLATAIPIVAPVAKQFGFTIEDTVTLLAKLSDAGMDASSAATATRNIFLKMANDSGKLAQALGRPVHSVEEFGEALAEMRNKGMSLSDILSMVGVRSTAAFAVFADNAETLKDFKQSITDCGDAMHDMESKQLDTLQGSVIMLNSAWEGLMLTFSESNGTIKTVVDSLTSLLQAWSKWRNRNAGGDAAIQSYELGVTAERKQSAELLYKGYKAGGTTDEQIKAKADAAVASLTKERDAAKKLYDELEKIEKRTGDAKTAGYQMWNNNLHKLFPSYNVKTDGAAPDYLARQIAAMNDNIAYQQYLGSLSTPAVAATSAAGGQGGAEQSVQLLRAKYEAEAKEQIAALDRMAMNEEDYEAKVYEIKRAALEQIAKLYDEDSKEYAQAVAKKYDLDIRYQATMLRLANRKGKDTGSDVYMAGPDRTPLEQMQQSIRIQQADAAALLDENTLKTLLGVAIQNGIDGLDLDFSHIMDDMQEGLDIPPETWKLLEEKINEQLAAMNIDPIKLDVDTGTLKTATGDAKSLSSSWQMAASAISAAGSAMQMIEDPAAKVAGIIAQAIAQVALGAGQAIAFASNGSAGGPWGWLAFAISATATMVSTIAAIKSTTKGYASGGMVEGTSYSGDNIVARLNAGEGVLTAKGVENAETLAGMAEGRGGGQITGTVTGANIYLALANFAKQNNKLAGTTGGLVLKIE